MYSQLVFLLLSSSLTLCWAGIVLEDGYPVRWNEAVTKYPMQPENNALTPDAWHYLQRLSMINTLIKTTDPYMRSLGPSENDTMLWGPALRMAWMFTSGRLADPTAATSCGTLTGETRDPCISPNSWFGCMHFYSSVFPFLSAVHNNYLGEGVSVQMQNPAGEERYCNNYDACKIAHPNLMAKWDAFFTGLKEKAASTLPDDEKKDQIHTLYWAGQAESWYLSDSVCKDNMNFYTLPEKHFIKDWLYVVEYSAIVNFQSSLIEAPKFLVSMPGRLMKADDHAPNIADMTPEVNLMLWSFDWTRMSDHFFGYNMLKMWRRVMKCSKEARETGRELLFQLMFNPETSTASFVSIMMAMTHCSG